MNRRKKFQVTEEFVGAVDEVNDQAIRTGSRLEVFAIALAILVSLS